MKTNQTAQDFLALPHTALPAAMFADDEWCWAISGDAWSTLRKAGQTGETCENISGSSVMVRADRDGWREWIEVK